MSGISDITNIWKNVKEIDLRPLREQAENAPKLAIVGAPGSGRRALAERLRTDPSHPTVRVDSPIAVLNLKEADKIEKVDLIILLLDASGGDESRQRKLAVEWSNSGLHLLVFRNTGAGSPGSPASATGAETSGWVDWKSRRVVTGSIDDDQFMSSEFAGAVIHLLPELLLALGRNYPLLRVSIARHLINDTSFSNAAYSLSTGVAEIIPIFDIPLNVADVIVLTKSQAFLVYKVGLALGLSTEWGDYVAEFGGVLGGGFVWRQIARQLVGLIPAWGIVPKVAVAYAGTYVVGNVVLQWYLTGKHLTKEGMRRLYSEAVVVGRDLARNLVARLPRPRLPRVRLRRKRQEPEALPSPDLVQVCIECGQNSAADAHFCQYCGHPFPEISADQPES